MVLPLGADVNDVAVAAANPRDALGRLVRAAVWTGSGPATGTGPGPSGSGPATTHPGPCFFLSRPPSGPAGTEPRRKVVTTGPGRSR